VLSNQSKRKKAKRRKRARKAKRPRVERMVVIRSSRLEPLRSFKNSMSNTMTITNLGLTVMKLKITSNSMTQSSPNKKFSPFCKTSTK
jgi:hypothetical protein